MIKRSELIEELIVMKTQFGERIDRIVAELSEVNPAGRPGAQKEADEKRLDQNIANALHILGKPAQHLTKWAQAKFETKVPWYDHTIAQKEKMYDFLKSKVDEAAR